MNEPNHDFQSAPLTFVKFWMETFARLGQAASSFAPDAAPPDQLRQVRAGMLQAIGRSWDDILRSPQFMQSMKELMENALAFRKLNTELMGKARRESGSVGQEDVDALLLAIRRLETRVLERLEGFSTQLAGLEERLTAFESAPRRPRAPAKPKLPASKARRTTKEKA
jgi:hypothetical protein